jgi:hypothetical protein
MAVMTFPCPHLSPEEATLALRAIRFAHKFARRNPKTREALAALIPKFTEQRARGLDRREKNRQAVDRYHKTEKGRQAARAHEANRRARRAQQTRQYGQQRVA